MSRSGYDGCLDGTELNLYRGAVDSAIRGKRGQKLLRELAEAMDAMLVKELASEVLEQDGKSCALGVVGKARGIDVSKLDPYDTGRVAEAFDIAYALAAEIAYENDEGHYRETDVERWARVRKWVGQQIKDTTP